MTICLLCGIKDIDSVTHECEIHDLKQESYRKGEALRRLENMMENASIFYPGPVDHVIILRGWEEK